MHVIIWFRPSFWWGWHIQSSLWWLTHCNIVHSGGPGWCVKLICKQFVGSLCRDFHTQLHELHANRIKDTAGKLLGAAREHLLGEENLRNATREYSDK